MAAAIAVTVEPGNFPPRVAIVVTGMSGVNVTVTRNAPDGTRVRIRTANPAPLSGGSWPGYDYENWWGTSTTYTATSNNGDTVTSAPITLLPNPIQPWLIHPGVPSFSLPVPGLKLPDEDEDDINQGVHQVLGRADAIIITDGARHLPSFEVTVRTDTAAELASMKRILSDGSPLLLQVAYDWTPATQYQWLAVGPTKRQRRSGDWTDPSRNVVMQCLETVAPSGLQQAQWTWDDVVASYGTWDDVVAAFPTWDDLVLNRPVNN